LRIADCGFKTLANLSSDEQIRNQKLSKKQKSNSDAHRSSIDVQALCKVSTRQEAFC